jgi:hypothetical protein
MRGFFAGSLALIVFYTVLQPASAKQTQQAGNVAVQLLQRALSPGVAGIPNKGSGMLPLGGQTPAPAGGGGGHITYTGTAPPPAPGVINL